MQKFMDITELLDHSLNFDKVLTTQKQQLQEKTFWYPYSTLSIFTHLNSLLTGKNRSLPLGKGNIVADIGAADGDLSFFLSTLGVEPHIIDYAPTNFNGLLGAKHLRDAHYPDVLIHEVDLDSQFTLPKTNFDLVFLLGILYHLKNPFFVLERLAYSSSHCLISTRIAKYAPDNTTNISKFAMTYLVDNFECNNDPTNFWMFSQVGLERILKRSGWKIMDMITVGDVVASNPRDSDHDERAFCLVESTVK